VPHMHVLLYMIDVPCFCLLNKTSFVVNYKTNLCTQKFYSFSAKQKGSETSPEVDTDLALVT
jgi:hypothetical protein